MSIVARNVKKLGESLKENINYVDVTYKGINEKSIFNTVIENGSAILNAYKIWLQSSADDYIRNYNYAGFFDDYLNRYPFDESSIPAIKQELISVTEQKFPKVRILALDVHCDKVHRGWKLRAVVQDTLTGYIGLDMAVFKEYIDFAANY